MQEKNDKPKVVASKPLSINLNVNLFHAIKYNQGLIDESHISESDIIEFNKFTTHLNGFFDKLESHDQGAFSLLSSLMSTWGYSRKYCGMCGRPVIGEFKSVQNRITCKMCYASYKITEALLKRDSYPSEQAAKPKSPKVDKSKSENA